MQNLVAAYHTVCANAESPKIGGKPRPLPLERGVIACFQTNELIYDDKNINSLAEVIINGTKS